MRHLRVLRSLSGPCLEILGGAALFLFITCAAAAAGETAGGQAADGRAASVELPRAAWLGEFDFTSAAGGQVAGADWTSVERDIESRFPETSVPLNWRSGGFRADTTGDLLGRAFSFDKISWRDVPPSAAEGFLVHTGRIAPGRGPGAVILKTTAAFDAPARRKLFFDADYFLAIYLNGAQVSRGYFSGAVRPDSSSIDVDFPQGPSEIAVVVGRRAGCGDFYLRIGSAHVTKRRIAVLSELERRFPDDRGHVLAAQREIAGLFTGALGDNAQGEIELKRLCAMAGGDAPSKAHALERLAEIYGAAGRAGGALAVLRSRMDLPECAGNDAGACRKAAIAFAEAAAAGGDLPAALDALATAAERTGEDPSLALSRAQLLAAYSLAGRARLECDALGSRELDESPRGVLAAAKNALDALRPNPAFVSLNHTASARFDSVKELATVGAYERAAPAILEMLDAEGPSLVGGPDCAVGTAFAVLATLKTDAALAEAYRKALDGAPPCDVAPLAATMARRPMSPAAAEALRRAAVESAAKGEYEFCALAARRLLADFPAEAGAAALCISALSAAGRGEEAGELAAALPGEITRGSLAPGATFAEHVSRTLGGAGESAATPAYALEMIKPSNVLRIEWKAPIRPSGFYRFSGRPRHGGAARLRVAADVFGSRAYVFDGRTLASYSIDSGDRIFEVPVFVPAGMRPAGERDAAGANTVIPGAGVSAGPGAVYYTSFCRDDLTNRAVAYVVAASAETGQTLWASSGQCFGDGLVFNSAPVYSNDRVHVMMHSGATGGGPQNSYLACLDAPSGAAEFLTLVDSCYMPLSNTPSWAGAAFDPAVFSPGPAVSLDTVYASGNSGALAAVDCLTGAVRSVATYPRSVVSAPESGLMALLGGRSMRPPVAAESVALFCPNDSAEAFAMRPGEPAVAFETPGIREAIGVFGDTSVTIGDGVCGVDTRTGKTLWRAARSAGDALPGDLVTGGLVAGDIAAGGIVAGSIALVPASKGLLVISAADGRTLAACPWPDGVPRGNLRLAGDTIIATGDADVAALRFADSEKTLGSAPARPARAAESVPSIPGSRAAMAYASASGVGGLWAAPAPTDTYLLKGEASSAGVTFAEEGRALALLPGHPASLWDISGGAVRLWAIDPPIDIRGAVTADDLLAVYNEASVAALDTADGKVLWRHDARGEGAIAAAGALKAVTAYPGRVSYIAGGRAVILDGRTGAVLYSFDMDGQIVASSSDATHLAVVTAGGNGPDVLRVLNVTTGAVQLVAPVGPTPDGAARVTFSDEGHALLVCPTAGFAECIDVATARVLWRDAERLKLDTLTQFGCTGGRLYFAGSLGGAGRLVMLDALTGAIISNGPLQGRAVAAGGSIYARRLRGGFVKVTQGKKPVWEAEAGLDEPWQAPVAAVQSGDQVLFLVADSAGAARRPLSLAAYNAATGEKAGQWDLPLVSRGRDAGLTLIAPGIATVSTSDGVLRIAVPIESAGFALPVVGAQGGEREAAASFGAVTGLKGRAAELADIVVDGDLADWGGAAWMSVRSADTPLADVAFASNAAGFFAAVRTIAPGEAGRIGAREPANLRLSIDGGNTSAASNQRVDVDVVIAGGIESVFPTRGKFAVTARRRPNGAGGWDYEFSIPWSAFDRKGDDISERGFLGVAVAGEIDHRYWSWPTDSAYLPGGFGTVKLEWKER